MWFQRVTKWVASIPSEPTGEGSASRVGLLTLTFVIGFILIATTVYQHRMPTHDELTGVAAILAAMGGTYGVNKVVTAFKSDKE